MKKLLTVAGTMLLLGSCYNDKYDKLYPNPTVVACDTTTVTFNHDIMPILTTYCNIAGGCHDAAGTATSGFNFTTYGGIVGMATQEILINDIKGTPTGSFHVMPKGLPKMPDCEIKKMTRWVNLGAPNN